MNKPDQAEQGKRHYREMTVAHIRDQVDADYVEVIFLESARFYRLFRKNPTYHEALRLLRDALAKGRVLIIGVTSLGSDMIEEIREHRSYTTEQNE